MRDPTTWTTWGSGGGVKEARSERKKDECRKAPMVSVLLPVKGVHERTLMHWRSQVKASHGGRMEFIFCMESEEDPAYAAALDFRRECGDSVEIKIVSCGLSFYCSQKIHNLLKGITLVNREAHYVLFLDDDAQMSSRILSDLVYALETEPDVLIASGWPNDYLPPNAAFTPTFASFMLLGYRVLSHLSMGTLYPTVLWGGCLLLRRSELLDPQIGIIEAWKQSGYSDDMIMIGRARKAQRKIVVPPSAFLPSKIERDYSLQRHIKCVRADTSLTSITSMDGCCVQRRACVRVRHVSTRESRVHVYPVRPILDWCACTVTFGDKCLCAGPITTFMTASTTSSFSLSSGLPGFRV